MATDPTQRVYRAPCPGCGAPVVFRSAQSSFAVCSYCQSTVVRQGDVLSRIGRMAELFDDFSPLQLMTSGTLPGAGAFTLVGRLQYQSDTGPWTEWHALFDADGSSGLLGEDNGAFVFSRTVGRTSSGNGNGGFDLDAAAAAPDWSRELPAAEYLRIGNTTAIEGKLFTVTANRPITLVAAQGELPRLPTLGQPFAAVELRAPDGEVLTIEYDRVPPTVSRGRSVQLQGLQLTGLKDESAREEKGRQFDCPNCGAPVTVKLQSTKSITCASCGSIVDLSAGIGAELRHAEQDAPVQPSIRLGTEGRMQGVSWQVVGFQHRMGRAAGDDESFGWSEYLLFNGQRGFSFLVDSEEGWSLLRPTTGAPQLKRRNANSASYLGTAYELKYSYDATTDYVAGEFYWPVQRGQRTFNRDFANGPSLLTAEQTPTELTWSIGGMVAASAVAEAFGLDATRPAFAKKRDALPFSAAPQLSIGFVLAILLLMIVLGGLLSMCSNSDRSGYSRSSGGSYGGYSTGGGHK
ncbi:MAG: DUF4178 domain-containing protein [Burkholderiales bacterium]